jgi:Fe-S-cluster containining protein
VDFITAMFERECYASWLEKERKERVPAGDRDLTECVRCGWCCALRTCVPTPDEIPAIAGYLGLTVEELVKTYMVGDSMMGHEFLRFANTAQTDVLGQYLDTWRTYDKGVCLLYRDGGCAIYPVRPADARTTACWEKGNKNDRYKAMEAWADGDMEKFGVEPWGDWEDDEDEW